MCAEDYGENSHILVTKSRRVEQSKFADKPSGGVSFEGLLSKVC